MNPFSYKPLVLFCFYCDTVGDYDVVVPDDIPSGTYSIRVGRFDDDGLYDCSDSFDIIHEDEDSMSLSYML